jgi:hypothetical protein
MLLAQQFLVVVVIGAAICKRNNVVDVDADADLVLSSACLAQAVISGPDAFTVLYASRAALALYGAGADLESGESVAYFLQAGLEGG